MSAEISEVVIIVLAGTFLMLLLVVFIISFFFVHQQRQQRYRQEKAALEAQFEQELLTVENEIQEQTMRHISRELHDNVVQMLSLVKIQLNNLQAEIPNTPKIAQSKEYLTTAIGDLRTLSKTLNSENILVEGIAKSIDFELNRVGKASGLIIHFREQGEIFRLTAQQEIIVFRIFQELIQNVLKHAQAKNIWVLLEETDSFFKIEVKDDGTGFDFDQKQKIKGFESGGGLHNMVYRAGLLKGDFGVRQGENGGTLSSLTIPINPSV